MHDLLVSVIIPVYNDPNGLSKTVDSLLQQTADQYEIIIADNGSTDKTKHIAQQYTQTEFVTLVVEDEIQSSYAARNKGVQSAKGDIIAFMDADMWVESDYIQLIREIMSDNECMCVGFDVDIISDGGSIGRYNAAYGFPIKRYISEGQFIPTCCLVVRRSLFDMVGLFDEQMISSGDAEFSNRVVDAGFDLVFEPRITMYHPARSTVISLIRKSIRIGRGREQLYDRHPQISNHWSLLDPRIILPPYPRKFIQQFSDAVESRWEYVLWYFLTWTRKLARLYGRVNQRTSSIVSCQNN